MARLMLKLPPNVLIILTLATKYFEKFGFLCFVIPWKTHYWRMLGVVGFWAMHFAFGSALRIGSRIHTFFFPIFFRSFTFSILSPPSSSPASDRPPPPQRTLFFLFFFLPRANHRSFRFILFHHDRQFFRIHSNFFLGNDFPSTCRDEKQEKFQNFLQQKLLFLRSRRNFCFFVRV